MLKDNLRSFIEECEELLEGLRNNNNCNSFPVSSSFVRGQRYMLESVIDALKTMEDDEE